MSVPALGHGPFDLDSWQGGGFECFDGLALQLLATGDAAKVDTSCVRAMKPPPFAVAQP